MVQQMLGGSCFYEGSLPREAKENVPKYAFNKKSRELESFFHVGDIVGREATARE
jgi:hypothetical protein